ncbi:MAG: DUF6159 family protein [Planctomycetota bacterium]
MGRIGRGFRMMKQSFGLLRKDKELMVLPLLSGIAIAIVVASFFFGMGFHKEGADVERMEGTTGIVTGFVLYVITYTVAFFFQAALVAGASERLRGGDPTLGSALTAARKRLGPIVMWAVVAATVGMILRAIQDKSEWLGKVVAGIAGAAWSLATFFVVPVLVLEQQGVGGSMKRSVQLFKKTWGETVTGHVGFGIASFVLMLPVLLVAGLLFAVNPILGIVIGLLGIGFLSVFFAALQGIFTAALYRYAADDVVPEGFSQEQIAHVFG